MERIYRKRFNAADLVYYNVKWLETDIYAATDTDLREICELYIIKLRDILDRYTAKRPVFKTTLSPLSVTDDAPEIARKMAEAGCLAGTGPMAAVAGAFNAMLYEHISGLSSNIILENGGDILIAGAKPRRVGIYAGENKLKDKLTLEIDPGGTAIAVCTSSGTLGHSLSFGKADSVTIISRNSYVADAAATAVANTVKTPQDIEAALQRAMAIKYVDGAVITVADTLGACGSVKFV